MEAQEIRYRVNKKVFRQASLHAMFFAKPQISASPAGRHRTLPCGWAPFLELPADLHIARPVLSDAFAARVSSAPRHRSDESPCWGRSALAF